MFRVLRIVIGWPILWIGHSFTATATSILPDGVFRAAGMTVTIVPE
ncbi:hypothetical protein [Tritonibacter mobilis]